MDSEMDSVKFKQKPEKVHSYVKELFSVYNYHIQKVILKAKRKNES